MHKSFWQQLGQYNDFAQRWGHFIMKSFYTRKIFIVLGTCYSVFLTDLLFPTSWHVGHYYELQCWCTFWFLNFRRCMINSALLLCLGSCRELSREQRPWGLGAIPVRNDPLKSIETVSEGSRMRAAGSSSGVSDLSAQARGCVCPHFYSYRNYSHLHRGGITSQPQNGREDAERNAQDSSSMARGQRAELWWDSASTSCRARLLLPPCPSYGHWHSQPLQELGNAS